MMDITNYQIISQVDESANSFIYRCVRKKDGKSVILKTLKQNYPSPAALTHYQQEYEIISKFNSIGIVKTYGLETYQHRLILVLEDFGAQSLKQFINGNTLSIEEFLPLAIQIVDSLNTIHSMNIIHKDINPTNIVIHPTDKTIKIIDFGIATALPRENLSLVNPEKLEGTLFYMSPEQTGRINRLLDYRTDFYSLGVTFYEMLTGKLPFYSKDPLELIHCHLAKSPIPPEELNTNIPTVLSDIILKLMSKNAEDRYQSASGIQWDLQHCYQKWQETQKVTSFILAQNDFSGKFQIPQKLYGRTQEIQILLNAFTRISQGIAQIVLVSGYSGVGKTSLIKEVHKPMTEKRGYFASGKFNQYQRNVPYSAITQAFNQFCDYLLAESTDRLNIWRDKILAAVGSNGQVLIDIIPQLELVIGQQPPVASLNATEAQNRFNSIFQQFFCILCQPEHPLVLFIDDLQWADSASLNLLKILITDKNSRYFLIVGAYRDNAVDEAHPLILLLEELKKETIKIETIPLANLSFNDVNHLVAEAVMCQPENTQTLTQLVYSKTQGNAFFTNEFLKSLHKEELLTFDHAQYKWHWDINKIATKDMTDNVVVLMTNKISRLPSKIIEVIKLAACIGNRFDLETLSIICQKSKTQTFTTLWKAVEESLIIPLDDNYKCLKENGDTSFFQFQHDRIQQAAYSLIIDSYKPMLHLRIGRLLLKNVKNLEDKLFSIVDHLNIGQLLIYEIQERISCIELNLQAAKKSKESTAYNSSLQYLLAAFHFLEEESFRKILWTSQYELALALYTTRAEVEYLNGNFEQSEKVILQTVSYAKTALDKAKVYQILIVEYTLLARYQEAITTGRKALALIGIDLPENDFESNRDQEIAEIQKTIGHHSIASLFDLPLMSQPDKRIAVDLLIAMGPPCYRAYQRLWAVIVPKVVNLCLKYGNVPQIGYSHTAYGGLLGWVCNDYTTAEQFGELAYHLMMEKFHRPAELSVFYLMMGSSLRHWSKHLKYATQDYQEAYNVGVESSNLQYAAYAFGHNMYCRFYQGIYLDELLKEIENHLIFSRKHKNQWAIDLLDGGRLIITTLQGMKHNGFCTDDLTEEVYLNRCENNKNIQVVCIYFILKTWVLYLHHRLDEAFNSYHEAEKRLISVGTQGLLPWAEHVFTHSLLLAALYPHAPVTTRQEYLRQLCINQQQMKIWAHHCPDNFQHQYLLISAEMARLEDHALEAMDLYDQTIEEARKQGFVQHEALANELAAQFWLKRNKVLFAESYLRRAHHKYQLWGAHAKTRYMEDCFPQWSLRQNKEELSTVIAASISTEQTTSSRLDLETVMRASQTLSEEIVLDKLVEKMLRIVIESAGAERGVLILQQNDQWVVEAEGIVNQEKIIVLHALSLEERVPLTIINYVIRVKNPLLLTNTDSMSVHAEDHYLQTHKIKSVLCAPIIHKQTLIGLIYLENNLSEGVFTTNRLKILTSLLAQMAISLENARFVAELERARQISEIANQTKTTFLANVSHELRTPLNSILGFNQLLSKSKELTDEQRESLNIIQRSAQYLLTLVNDILEISHLQTAQIKQELIDFDLVVFLKKIVEIFQDRAEEKGLIFTYLFPIQKEFIVQADEKRLRQVLVHLLSNAVKFTDQGKITFETFVEQQSDYFRCYFEIRDTGIGISPENLDKIFLPFEQLSDWRHKSEGAGLGLSLVKHLVEIMKGEIQVESQVGKGSCFRLKLDLASGSEPVNSYPDLSEETSIESKELITIKPPAIEQIEELLEFIKKGDIRGVIEYSKLLEEQDSELKPFVKEVIQLAKKFSLKKLRELVKSYLDK